MATSMQYPEVTVCLFLFGTTVLTYCFATRSLSVESWKALSYSRWLLLLIYVDSYFFVASTSILQVGVGLTSNMAACEASIFMCIFFYFTSKVIIYLFLIERVHIVRGSLRTRRRDKFYLFNMLGLLPYCVIGVLAIVYRVHDFDHSGKCLIGVERQTSILVIVYDLVINVYLTIQFLLPILGLYSYQHEPNTRLRKVALRTFVGTILTLISSVANITAIFVLKGLEPAFVCLTCCTLDVAFSATVLHWVTSVRVEEGPHFPPRAQCAFHHRTSTICCIACGRQSHGLMARGFFARLGLGFGRRQAKQQASLNRGQEGSRRESLKQQTGQKQQGSMNRGQEGSRRESLNRQASVNRESQLRQEGSRGSRGSRDRGARGSLSASGGATDEHTNGITFRVDMWRTVEEVPRPGANVK